MRGVFCPFSGINYGHRPTERKNVPVKVTWSLCPLESRFQQALMIEAPPFVVFCIRRRAAESSCTGATTGVSYRSNGRIFSVFLTLLMFKSKAKSQSCLADKSVRKLNMITDCSLK